MQSEKALGALLEAKVKSSDVFAAWLLSKTKFKGRSARHIFSRSDHPWHKSKTTGKESETDVLLVFEDQKTLSRFAIHVELKLAGGRFEQDQPEQYPQRAEEWRGIEKWGNYDEFTVVLIAPEAFHKANADRCAIFDSYIPFSEIAKFVPEFDR